MKVSLAVEGRGPQMSGLSPVRWTTHLSNLVTCDAGLSPPSRGLYAHTVLADTLKWPSWKVQYIEETFTFRYREISIACIKNLKVINL